MPQTHYIPPKQLVLETELLRCEIKSALLFHHTDRWYLGDFLRHSSWLTSLTSAGVERIDLVTHPDYLRLFTEREMVHKLIDVFTTKDIDLSAYDLVIVPSSFPPKQYDKTIKRAIYSWDRGWVYVRHGTAICTGQKNELNYFTAAKHQYGQSALPSATNVKLTYSEKEKSLYDKALELLFANKQPIIVYNPTASNPFTRETDLKKEVDNTLTQQDHAALLMHIRRELPYHNVLIASAIKPGDSVNREVIYALKKSFKNDEQVQTVFDLTLVDATTLRGFAVMLSTRRIKGIIGGGTGTNTHLAALVDVPSLSVERSVDEAMLDNWRHPDLFQMGSFRWRNPSSTVATYTLNWSRKKTEDFKAIAHVFKGHYFVSNSDFKFIFGKNYDTAKSYSSHFIDGIKNGEVKMALNSAIDLLGLLKPEYRSFYADFSDETAYLRLQQGLERGYTIDDIAVIDESYLNNFSWLILNLLKDSNLHKLAQKLNTDDPKAMTTGSEEQVFRKIRSGVPLSKKDLTLLGFENEYEVCDALNSYLRSYHIAESSSGLAKSVRSGWQHKVLIRDHIVVKLLATNSESEYLTDQYTIDGVKDALDTAGGVVPCSSPLLGSRLISKRIIPFIDSRSTSSELFGGMPIEETTLSLGWIEEQFDSYIQLLRQGVFNFDIKFTDTGINDYGVYQICDFSVFRKVEDISKYENKQNLRIDILHMGINELIRNAQIFSRFKNGSDAVSRYTDLVKNHIGIDIEPLVSGWEWGKHGMPDIEPMAKKLKSFIAHESSNKRPLPVYGLVDRVSEELAYSFVCKKIYSNSNHSPAKRKSTIISEKNTMKVRRRFLKKEFEILS